MDQLHPLFAAALAPFAPPAQSECGECGDLFTPAPRLGYRMGVMCSRRCVLDSMCEVFGDESDDADEGDEA